jgi:hypothetical protein
MRAESLLPHELLCLHLQSFYGVERSSTPATNSRCGRDSREIVIAPKTAGRRNSVGASSPARSLFSSFPRRR